MLVELEWLVVIGIVLLLAVAELVSLNRDKKRADRAAKAAPATDAGPGALAPGGVRGVTPVPTSPAAASPPPAQNS